MEGIRLQDRIYNGYGKAAAHLGVQYAQYRSASHLLPIAPGNLLRTLPMVVTAETKFHTPNKYHVPTALLWADGRLLKQFDFLVGPHGTLFVGDQQPLLPMQAVATNRVVTLGRATYSTVGAIQGSSTPYATGLPVFMQYKREEIKPSAYVNAMGEGIGRWLAFVPLPNGTVKQDDEMIDEEGTYYTVDAADYTPIGYVLGVRHSAL